ncbi:MAG TPA: hypothetical protein VGK67_05570, partial [Myxococcales bacterium]
MLELEFPAFRALMDTVAQGYRLPPLEPGPFMLEFRALEEYSFDQVDAAVAAHKKDPVNGRYYPTAAHLIAKILGPQPDRGRVLPDAYREFNPKDRYALPALPLSPEEKANLDARELDRAARLEEERREVGKRIRALRDRLKDVAKPFPQDRQRDGA